MALVLSCWAHSVVARSPDRPTAGDRRSPLRGTCARGDLRSATVAWSGDQATTALTSPLQYVEEFGNEKNAGGVRWDRRVVGVGNPAALVGRTRWRAGVRGFPLRSRGPPLMGQPTTEAFALIRPHKPDT